MESDNLYNIDTNLLNEQLHTSNTPNVYFESTKHENGSGNSSLFNLEKENITNYSNYHQFMVENVQTSPLKMCNRSTNAVIMETPLKDNEDNSKCIFELNKDFDLPLNKSFELKSDFLIISNSLRYLNDSGSSETGLNISAQNQSLDCFEMDKNPSEMHLSMQHKTPEENNDPTSPDLFSEDEIPPPQCDISSHELSLNSSLKTKATSTDQDKILLKRIQECFKGILPPPSVTNCQLSANEILTKYKDNESALTRSCNQSGPSRLKSLILNCNGPEEIFNSEWPNVLKLRYHGVHYNYSKVSEEIENLSQKYIERFITNETSTFCSSFNNISIANSKKKLYKKQACKSPGRRLSHLARRRVTFSMENISARGSVLPTLSTSKRQLVIDVKESDILIKRRISPRKCSPRKGISISPRKYVISPRKRTPRKTPSKRVSPRKRAKTPSSSMKKTNTHCISEDRSVSKSKVLKRALFQSPEEKTMNKTTSSRFSGSGRINESDYGFTSSVDRTIRDRVNKSKRALFSTDGNIPVDDNLNRKRKRSEAAVDDDFTPQRDKFPRSLSLDDGGIGTKNNSSVLIRRHSEMISTSVSEFSEHHRKKMLWAISTALRTQNIGMSHPNFKTYATALSQICKRLLPDLLPGGVRIPGSVNERMSKIAHQHVYDVVRGKPIDEIIEGAKIRSIQLTQQKPKGYIAPEYFTTDTEVSSTTITAMENSPKVANSKTDNRLRIKRQIIFDK